MENISGSFALLMIIVIGVIMFASIAIMIFKSYKKVPNNELVVVYGGFGKKKKKVKEGETLSAEDFKICHGGSIFVVPFFQGFKKMDLSPYSIQIDLRGALTTNSVRVDIPSMFTVGIEHDKPEILNNAIRRLLDADKNQIETQCQHIIVGQLRDVVSRMEIADLINNRQRFLTLINESVETELNKIGLTIINVNIIDVDDEGGYIKALGQKSITKAVQDASVEVAEQNRIGNIGVAENEKEEAIQVKKANSDRDMQVFDTEKNLNVRKAQINAEQKKEENKYRAEVASSESEYAIAEAEYQKNSNVAKSKAEKEQFEIARETRQAEIMAQTIPQAESERARLEIEAQTRASQARIDAEGEAEAIKIRAEANANQIETEANARAKGFEALVAACNGDVQQANYHLYLGMIENLEKIKMKGLENIKIDKVTIIGNGGSNGGEKGAVSNFVNDWMNAVPGAEEALKANGFNAKLPFHISGNGSAPFQSAERVDNTDSDKNEDSATRTNGDENSMNGDPQSYHEAEGFQMSPRSE